MGWTAEDTGRGPATTLPAEWLTACKKGPRVCSGGILPGWQPQFGSLREFCPLESEIKAGQARLSLGDKRGPIPLLVEH